MGHLFKYHSRCQTAARPKTCLVQTSHIFFLFKDVNFCHVCWSLQCNVQWNSLFFRTLWELVAMTFRSGRNASIRMAMAVCSSPRPANWTPSWRNSSSKLAITQVCWQIEQSINYVYLFEIWSLNALICYISFSRIWKSI